MKYWKYLKYILRHKYFVFIECYKEGIIWRGLTHDLSKFFPSEFFPYYNHFYGKDSRRKFEVAWLKHKHRNDHHWQYWVNTDYYYCFKMPNKARREMICDWKAMSKSKSCMSTYDYWLKNKDKIRMHPETKKLVEKQLKRDYK